MDGRRSLDQKHDIVNAYKRRKAEIEDAAARLERLQAIDDAALADANRILKEVWDATHHVKWSDEMLVLVWVGVITMVLDAFLLGLVYSFDSIPSLNHWRFHVVLVAIAFGSIGWLHMPIYRRPRANDH